MRWRWDPFDADAGMARLIWAEVQALYVCKQDVRPDIRYFELDDHAYIAVGDGELPTYMTDFVAGYSEFQDGLTDTYAGPEVVRSLAGEAFLPKKKHFKRLRALGHAIALEVDNMGCAFDLDLDDPVIAADVRRYAVDARTRGKDSPLLPIPGDLTGWPMPVIWASLPPEVQGQLRYLHLDYASKPS